MPRGDKPVFRRLSATLGPVASVLVLAYLGFCGYLYFFQERLLFHPDVLPADYRFHRAADVHELTIPVPGASLSALHLRLPNPKGIVFYLHGNGGNVESWFVQNDFYRQANFDLFMLDYRGYGKSSGRIESQEQLLADIGVAWERIAALYPGRVKVLYGRSLGTGPAALLAAQVHPELTILASPYCSMAAMARRSYPWVPSWLLRYPLATAAAAAAMTTPLLLIHGEDDTLIPPSESGCVQAAAPAARVHRIAAAGHNDLHESPAYRELLRTTLEALPAGPGGPAR